VAGAFVIGLAPAAADLPAADVVVPTLADVPDAIRLARTHDRQPYSR
jgi:hypothetical protein